MNERRALVALDERRTLVALLPRETLNRRIFIYVISFSMKNYFEQNNDQEENNMCLLSEFMKSCILIL